MHCGIAFKLQLILTVQFARRSVKILVAISEACAPTFINTCSIRPQSEHATKTTHETWIANWAGSSGCSRQHKSNSSSSGPKFPCALKTKNIQTNQFFTMLLRKKTLLREVRLRRGSPKVQACMCTQNPDHYYNVLIASSLPTETSLLLECSKDLCSAPSSCT